MERKLFMASQNDTDQYNKENNPNHPLPSNLVNSRFRTRTTTNIPTLAEVEALLLIGNNNSSKAEPLNIKNKA